jgi:uncharacterized protein YdcH (DUF465 family)
MSDDNELQMSPKEELEMLKAKADLMGITYHPSIGAEKLREKIRAKLDDEPEAAEAEPEVVAKEPVETAKQKRARLMDELSKLVRVRVTCMNPAKKEWEGEIISAGNSIISFTKYVPFNADDGWHVPNFIYQVMKDRECQVFTTVTDGRGNKSRKGKLIKEFAIEVLPPLTQEELHELAQRQAMSKSID